MKYTIISLNDERQSYKETIRELVLGDELHLPAFDAYRQDPLEGIKDRGLKMGNVNPKLHQWENAKRGELGVWLSNYDRWEYTNMLGEPLIVFEDDAIPDLEFNSKFKSLMAELPDDWDFAALWVPENQRQDYYYDVEYNEFGDPRVSGNLPAHLSKYRIHGNSFACLVYQGYGMVSLVYSPNGARKLVDLAHIRGIDGPVDCWVYEEAHKGNLKGYAPMPDHANIVHYDWSALSHVQQSGRLR